MAKIQSTLRRRLSAGVRMLLCAVALCFTLGEARAQIKLPPPVIHVQGAGHVSKGTAGNPTPSAICAAVAETNQSNGCTANISYDFEVLGSPDEVVPITIDGFAAYIVAGAVVSDKGSTQYDASAGIFVGNSPVVDVFAMPGQTSFGKAGVLFINATSDSLYVIGVYTTVGVNNYFIPNAITDVVAYADPQVSFASGFNSTGYTLEFSPGILNGPPLDYIPSAIPEPSTWAMMLLGFAGLGFAGRRMARKNTVLAV